MESYVGEIRLFASTYAPEGWALCMGQELPIKGNDQLFSLIGTTYGGDGKTTFKLPDLRGLVVCGTGKGTGLANTYALGQTVGAVSVTLLETQMPSHTHALEASSQAGDSTVPTGKLYATAVAPNPPPTPVPSYTVYATAGAAGFATRNMENTVVMTAGAGQPHSNLMPTVAVSYIICLQGFFPN